MEKSLLESKVEESIEAFERYLTEHARQDALARPERAIIKTYMLYLLMYGDINPMPGLVINRPDAERARKQPMLL